MLTYNQVIKEYGEETGLVYEQLVANIIDNLDIRIDMLRIADTTDNLSIAHTLIQRAKEHARQELKESIK